MILIALGKTLEELKNMFMDTESIYTLEIERNGETLSTNKILNTEVTPLAEGEKTCTYVAVFTAN